MSAYKLFDKEDAPYSPKLINKYILVLQRTQDQKKIDQTVILLFIGMKRVVLKNVNNYLSLINNSSVRTALEADELKTEAFIVLKNCLNKYNVSKANNFYFYYNKSLSRNFYRMYEKEVKKNTSSITDINSNYLDKLRTNIDLCSIGTVVDLLNLDKFEKLIIESKMNNEKKEDFLDKHPNISTSTYYNCIKVIKEKLKKLVADGEL